MGQAPLGLKPFLSAAHFFGAELRHWRVLRGLSQEELGRLTHDSGSAIGKVEKAVRRPTLRLAQRCDEALRTGGALQRLWPLVCGSSTSGHSDGGLRPPSTAGDVGLAWEPDLRDTVATVSQLWRADMERRSVIVNAAWVSAAFAAATRDWLLEWADTAASSAQGRRIGRADIDVLWSMCATFSDLDHRMGGGHARATLAHYVNTAVLPMLSSSYETRTGQQLMGAAARLCNLGGFMAFDCGLHGLAQRYYIQALRLAQASGDRALGAHILADMSMQAHFLRDHRESLALALAGQRTSRDCGSTATLSRCYAMEARARALVGDATGCAAAMTKAEKALDTTTDDEPSWIRFFTYEQLTAEFLYAANDLGQALDVERLAPTVLLTSDGMQRRLVLTTITLASAQLGGRAADIETACATLQRVVPITVGLSSPRTLDLFNTVRARMSRHASHPSVQAFEEQLSLSAAGTN